jgi:enediyne biosynthesis protein E4
MKFAALATLLLLPTCIGYSSGIEFVDILRDAGLEAHLQGMMGHAAAWGDFNNDNLPDLFVAGFCDRPNAEYLPAQGPSPSRLFRNLGNGKFEQIKNSPVEFYGRTSGAIFADLNGDGYPELYASNNAKEPEKKNEVSQPGSKTLRSKLYKNAGGSFVDVSIESGACPTELMTARNIGAFDYNGDGLIDLFVVEDKFKPKKSTARSILLKNSGNLKFQIANAEAGIPDDIYGLGLAIADLNEDGRADFFVPHSNRLFLSQPGNKYREARELETTFRYQAADNEDWPSGAAFGDLNLDGQMDLVITVHHAPSRNKVFLNRGVRNGIPGFEDITAKAGLSQSVPTKSPHVEIQDFDNDGLPDIYTSAAWKSGAKVTPLIYRNTGIQKDGVPQFAPLQKITSDMIYFPAGPTADFDRDGKLDILLINWFPAESSHLLKNVTSAGNWLQVKAPIGSKIKLLSAGKLVGYQQVFIGYGFSSGQLPTCHFGVANLRTVDLEIVLPNGTVNKMNKVTVNKIIEVKK